MKKVYVKIDANIYIYIYIYLYYIFLLMALIQGIKGLDKLYLKSLHLYLIKLWILHETHTLWDFCFSKYIIL
jgi:hypothetical protein